ncbi:MAG: hypothetical protein JNN27_00200 [Planctomycetes bacterium]|nr:hypothetical protein [Planctomycetota bacterium]
MQHTDRVLPQRTRCLALNSPAGDHAFFAQLHERVRAMPDVLPALADVAKAHVLRSPAFGA